MEAVVQQLRADLDALATTVQGLRAELPQGYAASVHGGMLELANKVAEIAKNQKGDLGDGKPLRFKDAEKHTPETWSGDLPSYPFSEFEFRMFNFLTILAPTLDGPELLKAAGNAKEQVDEDWFTLNYEDAGKVAELSRALSAVLVTCTKGHAATTVRRVLKVDPGNGLRAWQALSHWHRPHNAMEASTSMGKIIDPIRCKSAQELYQAVEDWELKVVEHESRFDEVIAESIKVAALRKMLPADMVDRFLDGPHDYKLLRAKLTAYLSERLSYAPRPAKSNNGTAPMDIGSVEASGTNNPTDPIAAVSQKMDDLCAMFQGKGGNGYYGRAGKGARALAQAGPKGAGPKGGGKGGKDQGGKGYGNWGKEQGGKGYGKNGQKGGKAGRINPNIQCYGCGGIGHPQRLCPNQAYNVEDDQGEELEQDAEEQVDLCALDAMPVHYEPTVEIRNMFGLLTIDDEDADDEPLYALEQHGTDGWAKLTAVVDSGAGDNVMPKRMVEWVPTVPTAKSKAGRGFRGPGGERIDNLGEKRVEVFTNTGQRRRTTWQVADVRRPLISAIKVAQAGNAVNLDEAHPHIKNKKTGEKTELRWEGNVCVMDLWVKVPGPPGIDSTPRAAPFRRQGA